MEQLRMSERIPDESAQILWNDNEGGKITDTCVIDYRDEELQAQLAETYNNSNGADTGGWLSGQHPIANPEGLFATLAFRYGFESPSVAKECVREFAQLESADWHEKCWQR
jgi:hypothetical protein